jgi:hypothetical protein
MSPFVRRAALTMVVALASGAAWPASGVERTSGTSRSARFRSAEDLVLKEVSRRGQGPVTMSRTGMPGRSLLAPVEEQEFDAIGSDGKISPSDTVGAAGPAHVLTAVNISYALWDKAATGTPTPALSGTLQSLFPSLPGNTLVFDPKVVYDRYAGQFVLIFLAGHGPPFSKGKKYSRVMVVTMPATTVADPGTWCARSINGDQVHGDGKQLADYPGLGYDAERVYITTNQFEFSVAEEYEYAQILSIGKDRLYNCSGKLNMDVFGGEETLDPGGKKATRAFTIMPAVTETEIGIAPPGFMLSFQDRSCGPGCGDRLTLWRVAQRKGRSTLAKRGVKVPRGLFAPLGTQKDGSPQCIPLDHCWDTGDLRVIWTFYDADRERLYTAHAVRFDVNPGDGYVESAIRWYEIDPIPLKRPILVRHGTLAFPGLDSGWPVMTTDAAGNLFITFSRAGAPAGEYLSAVVATIPPGAVVPDSVVVLRAGEALFVQDAGRFQRWGDFNGINRDPVDPFTVWTVNQYAKSDGTFPDTPLWQQVVNKVRYV